MNTTLRLFGIVALSAAFVLPDAAAQTNVPRITAVARTNGVFSMWWMNTGTDAVTVERSGSMTSGTWNPIAYNLVTGAHSDANAPTGAAFYRLRMVMALIPAGSFSMGNALSASGDGNADELPVHTVDVSAFYMDKYEVTKALWDEVREWGLTSGYTDLPVGGGKAANHPVHSISWYDMVKWSNARSRKEGLAECYTVSGGVYKTGSSDAVVVNMGASGYRLPTETEWEKAARGGLSGKRFPWGDTINHSFANCYNSANFYESPQGAGFHPSYATGGTPYSSPAGSFAPNGYGLYDMAGNMYERCWDWYSSGYYASSPSSDPTGPASGSLRVSRGGGWTTGGNGVRAAVRANYGPGNSDSNVGFRCVRTSVPMGMELIPAGSFSMGNALSASADGNAYELPVHTVDVSAFYMDRYEVTKALWAEVRAWGLTNGYTDLPVGNGNYTSKGADHPVHSIEWNEIVKWCNARSQKEGLTPCYTVSSAIYKTGNSPPVLNMSASGYRLPTEAEWEKAARGGLSGQRFPWGDTITHSHANYYSSVTYSYDLSPTRGDHPAYSTGVLPNSSPVGSFAPNGYGLYDMAGNMLEWCWDWYDGSYYASSPSSDPTGPPSGGTRVLRGGFWEGVAGACRIARRAEDLPGNSHFRNGFRCARSSVP